jgi:hypothetical protein
MKDFHYFHRLFQLIAVLLIGYTDFMICAQLESAGVRLQKDSTQYTHGIPDSEYNALWDLYNATNGADWHYLRISDESEWDFSNPNANPCAGKYLITFYFVCIYVILILFRCLGRFVLHLSRYYR